MQTHTAIIVLHMHTLPHLRGDVCDSSSARLDISLASTKMSRTFTGLSSPNQLHRRQRCGANAGCECSVCVGRGQVEVKVQAASPTSSSGRNAALHRAVHDSRACVAGVHCPSHRKRSDSDAEGCDGTHMLTRASRPWCPLHGGAEDSKTAHERSSSGVLLARKSPLPGSASARRLRVPHQRQDVDIRNCAICRYATLRG